MKAATLAILMLAPPIGGCVYHHETVRERRQDEVAATSVTQQLAAIPDSEQFVMHSKITNSDFLIQVARPLDLAPRPPGRKDAVVYVLDGSYMMGMMAAPARLMALENSIRPTFVVGIGFPEADPMAMNARRNRDLVHVFAEQQGQKFGPGGAAMERFIKEELRPAIEARYPVDPAQSVLAGHSLGGLFTTTVMANDPDAFAGYMIGSPSLRFDPALAERAGAIAGAKGGRVFIGVGTNEGSPAARAQMIAGADALEGALKRPGSGFVVARKTFPDETHVSVQGPWMSAGLRHVLPPQAAAPATRAGS